MTVNSQLMLDTMDYIDEHPDRWDQGTWSRCYFGTANKVAGVKKPLLPQPFQGIQLLGLVPDGLTMSLELWTCGIDRDELRRRVYAYIKLHDPDFYEEHIRFNGRYGDVYKVLARRARRGDFKKVTDLTVEQVLADRPERELQTTR